ncbi:hypothetical protein [Streptomyces tirandamycinicus]|uniref:Uncharacterized protein n=1 Tax=Streptomyces tirandamycinicus TaxID=2174846 RepID=A0A2S1T231_9ACTN|nr:hypothetical protein [Streptomyces tirandamycinicus]AWI32734.1 hypothetical protein DDW44_30950 [Streptomyces tirandamycinicus]
MTQIRLMDSDPGKAERTAAAVQRALEASPEVVVGNVAMVPNKRGPGARWYMEVLLLEARGSAARGEDQEVTVERDDARPRSSRRALPRGGRTLRS